MDGHIIAKWHHLPKGKLNRLCFIMRPVMAIRSEFDFAIDLRFFSLLADGVGARDGCWSVAPRHRGLAPVP